MPKKIKPAPRFLTTKLDKKTFEFVRANVTIFLDKLKAGGKGKNLDTYKILPDFFAFLGDRNPKFRHLDKSQLKTTHDGTYQVYNCLRKRLESIEEKRTTAIAAQIADKIDTPKMVTPLKSKKGKDEEAEVNSITATGHYKGHHEEKDVAFRRQMSSDQEESDPEAGEEGFEEEEEDPLVGKPKFERLRDMIVNLMANYDEDELDFIKIEHDFIGGHSNVNFIAKQGNE